MDECGAQCMNLLAVVVDRMSRFGAPPTCWLEDSLCRHVGIRWSPRSFMWKKLGILLSSPAFPWGMSGTSQEYLKGSAPLSHTRASFACVEDVEGGSLDADIVFSNAIYEVDLINAIVRKWVFGFNHMIIM